MISDKSVVSTVRLIGPGLMQKEPGLGTLLAFFRGDDNDEKGKVLPCGGDIGRRTVPVCLRGGRRERRGAGGYTPGRK